MIAKSKLVLKVLQLGKSLQSLFNTMEIFRSAMLINNVWLITAVMLTAFLSMLFLQRNQNA
ncbi:hypothetical protein DQQ10_01840 [Pseudochryseolinea flava]|uniref:Uncharacterized protein n=1 Tax=Pseudochryseolinea flava TaxID=2059302 RepID=A0A364Y8R5_9BACT|nr:hypothetical protein DQQ10_01840 [Pseudochryseolinea flava]